MGLYFEDGKIHYYVMYNKAGTPISWRYSDRYKLPKPWKEVSHEQYISDGGGEFYPHRIGGVSAGGSTPQPASETEMLEKKITALSDRNDFLEDCIAEMAGIVYSFEPEE